jgi:nucleoside-diphosphate-sugar epimerase
MLRPNKPPYRSVALRMTVDLAAVFATMMFSLLLPVGYEMFAGKVEAATSRLADVVAYYSGPLPVLVVLFPLTLLGSGVYTRSVNRIARQRFITLLRGIVSGILLFLGGNYLLFRSSLAPRSSMLIFFVLLLCVLPGLRLLKEWIQTEFAPPRSEPVSVSDNSDVVLVIGGAGYIGSSLVNQLLTQGRTVRVLDNLLYGDRALRSMLGHPRLSLQPGDCRNIQDVVHAVRGVNSLVHLAAIVGDPACEQDHETALQTNYAATRMILDVSKGHGVKRFVFASSCSVYGASDELMDESSAVRPISLYGHTKVDSERALLAEADYNFHVTILRRATVFGLSFRPRFDLVVNLLTAKALRDRLVTIYNGEQWRPFIHVDDVAAAMIAVLNAPVEKVSGEILNVGNTRLNFTLTQLAEKILTAFPGTRVEHVENGDRRNYRVSFAKIEERLGFSCRYSIEDGIRQIAAVMRSGEITDYMDPWYHNQKYLKTVGNRSVRNETDKYVMAAFARALPVRAEATGD